MLRGDLTTKTGFRGMPSYKYTRTVRGLFYESMRGYFANDSDLQTMQGCRTSVLH